MQRLLRKTLAVHRTLRNRFIFLPILADVRGSLTAGKPYGASCETSLTPDVELQAELVSRMLPVLHVRRKRRDGERVMSIYSGLFSIAVHHLLCVQHARHDVTHMSSVKVCLQRCVKQT